MQLGLLKNAGLFDTTYPLAALSASHFMATFRDRDVRLFINQFLIRLSNVCVPAKYNFRNTQ